MVNPKLIKLVEKAYEESNPKANRTSLKAAVCTVMNAIQSINVKGEFAVKYDDENMLDDVKIPSELKEFIIPSCVRRDVNSLASKDLLVRDTEPTETVVKINEHDSITIPAQPTLAQLNQSIATIRMSQRKGVNDDLVDIKSLRMPASLSDVFSKAAKALRDEDGTIKGSCDCGVDLLSHTDGKAMIPLILKDEAFSTEEDWYLNADASSNDVLVKNFISSKVSGLS